MSLCALSVLIAVAAMASEPVSNGDRAARLERMLLAPCCWSETVAVHRSPIALQMKSEIASFVGQGMTDRQILDYYKAKYGVRILIEPEGGARVLVNVIPWVAAVLGALAVGLALRHMARRSIRLRATAESEMPDLEDDDW
jgi:cytochrome c-type biogenesis protein CcmH